MNKFKRRFYKDRYGIVRGSISLCLLIALCLGLFISVQVKNNAAAEKNHAALAAQQVTTRFESMLSESIQMLKSCAAMVDDEEVLPDVVLDGMTNYGRFSIAKILPASSQDQNESFTIRQEGESLRLSCALESGNRLVAWIQATTIEEALADAFPVEYGYLVYNSQNGSFLINNTAFDAAGYYDILLNLNENGNLEELLQSSDGEALVEQNLFRTEGGYCIAQQSTEISPWSIALVIPESLLHNEAWNGRHMLFYAIAAEVLVLIFLVGHTVFVLYRIRLSNQNTTRALNMSEHMTNIIAEDARLTMFIYNRDNDCILAWNDGCDLLQDRKMHRNSIAALSELCSLENGEIDRIYDAITELRNQPSIELQLKGQSDAHDEQLWLLKLHVLDDNAVTLIGSIKDCTAMLLAQDREEQEHEFFASVQKKASSIWSINVSKNRWNVEYHKRDWLPRALDMQPDKWNNYSADLNRVLRNVLHPADWDSYMENMDPSGLMDAFRSGKNDFTQDYRVRSGAQQPFEWHRMQIRLWQDAKTSDVIANLYVFNVDAKKNAELERGERKRMLQQTLTALGGIYQGLYYVDIDNDLAYTARSLGGDVVDRLCMPYKAWIEQYIADSVYPEQQEAMRLLLSGYMIRRSLTEGTHLQLRQYKRRINDDIYGDAEVIIQPARFENGVVKEIVLAIRYVNAK